MTDAPISLRVHRTTGAIRQAVSSPRSLWAASAAVWERHRDLLSNTVSLIASTVITSGLGFAFWTFAAREFSQQAVGYGSAAISAMNLLGTIGVFGLGTVLIGELPRRSRRAGLVSAALLASGIGSLILGLGYAVISPLISKRLGDILGDPAEAAIFAVGVAITAVSSVFDNATIGLLRGNVQLSRNLIFSVAKMLALPVAALWLRDKFGAGISVSWIIGIAVSLAGSAAWLRIRGSQVLPRPDWAVLRGLGKTALAHNWLNLAIAVPTTLIPVVITVAVSPSANAAFYIAFMLSSFLYALPGALSTVLFAVASAEPDAISRKLRFAFKLSLLLGIPGMLALCFGAHFALGLFGKSYALEATFPLWMLALSYIPGLPRTYYVAVCRAAGKISRAAVVLTIFTVIEIGMVAVGGSIGGLRGVSVAIFAVTAIEGLITTPAVLSTIISRGRHRRTKTSPILDRHLTRTQDADIGYRKPGLYVKEEWVPCTEAYCICGGASDCPARVNRPNYDRQMAGVNALIRIAQGTAPTAPLPIIRADVQHPRRVSTPTGDRPRRHPT